MRIWPQYLRAGRVLALAAVGCIAAPLQAATDSLPDDGQLKISGSMRVRYEALAGQARPALNARDSLTSIRTILTATYTKGPLHFLAEGYDSRTYGGDAQTGLTTGEVNTMELVQANVIANLGDALGDGSKTKVQAGRMLINIGSRRLVAANEYRNTTNNYTGVRFDYQHKNMAVIGFFVLPVLRQPLDTADLLDNKIKPDRETFAFQFRGAVLALKFPSSHTIAEAQYYGLNERDEPSRGRATRDRKLHTVGGRVMREPKPGDWDYEVEGFYQFGSISASTMANAAQLDVNAYFLHADMGYQFASAWKPRFSVEYDYASGDKRGAHYGRFDTLFGARRVDLQPSSLLGSVGRANISSPGVRVEVTPSKKTDAFLSYRALWLATKYDAFGTSSVKDAQGRSGSFAGHQIDARIRHWLVPDHLRAELNWTYVAKGQFLLEAPNAPDTGDTRYVAVALTASF